MADAEVRDAHPTDASVIAELQVDTWRTAYSELLPADVLSTLDPERAAAAWADTLRNGPARVLLALEGGHVVGFCAAGPAPSAEVSSAEGVLPADAATTALISVLLVEPRWARRGHGGRLLGTAVEQLAAQGSTRGITWVPESDTASMAFFRGVGWDPDGTVRTLDASGYRLREMRLSGGLDLELVHRG